MSTGNTKLLVDRVIHPEDYVQRTVNEFFELRRAVNCEEVVVNDENKMIKLIIKLVQFDKARRVALEGKD